MTVPHHATPSASPELHNRAVGVILAAAAGDTLGGPYKFKPPTPPAEAITFHPGRAWTDNTAMPLAILEVIATHASLRGDDTLGLIMRRWLVWFPTAPDIGIRTTDVLQRVWAATEAEHLSDAGVARAARAAALAVDVDLGRPPHDCSNGCLMRTGPVALTYLRGTRGEERELAAATRAVAELTHAGEYASDACVIWTAAIRHACLTGLVDFGVAVQVLPEPRRGEWAKRLKEVEGLESAAEVPQSNSRVGVALLAASVAVRRGRGLVDTLERAVRCGGDTDTVATVAGALAGAVYGAEELPAEWKQALHGWPGFKAEEIAQLVGRVLEGGGDESDDESGDEDECPSYETQT